MASTTEELNNFGEAFKRKTTSFLLLGILLMIASMYLNSKLEHVGDVGIFYSQIIIWITVVMQIFLWIIYLIRQIRKLFNKEQENTKTH